MAIRTEEFQFWIGIPLEPEFEPIIIPLEYEGFSDAQKKAVMRAGRRFDFRSFGAYIQFLLEQDVDVYDVLQAESP